MLDRLATISQPPIRPDEGRGRSVASGPKVDFAAAAHPQQPEREAQAERARQAATNAATGFPHLRRRTDLTENSQAGQAAELPPHLERRRAWREAKGIGTFHAQNLAQNQVATQDAEQRAAALGVYRQVGGRGRLDIDLAQHVSVTV